MSEMAEGQASAHNRRAHPRSPIVVCEARCISGIEVFFGYALDVSRSGMFISTTKQRSPGDVYEIRFRVPSVDRAFECRARVVWTRRYRPGSSQTPGFGLQFLDLPEEDARIVDAWVRSVEPG